MKGEFFDNFFIVFGDLAFAFEKISTSFAYIKCEIDVVPLTLYVSNYLSSLPLLACLAYQLLCQTGWVR